MNNLIVEFLLTGQLCGVKVGIRIEEVKLLLGEPNEKCLLPLSEGQDILKYYDLQIGIDDNQVNWILIVFYSDTVRIPKKLSYIEYSFAGNIRISDFLDFLKENKENNVLEPQRGGKV